MAAAIRKGEAQVDPQGTRLPCCRSRRAWCKELAAVNGSTELYNGHTLLLFRNSWCGG
jgi:hypothetical protein